MRRCIRSRSFLLAVASTALLALAAASGCGPNASPCGTCPSQQTCVRLNTGMDTCAPLCGDGGACANGTNCQMVVVVPPAQGGVDPRQSMVNACVAP
jgi:hypothetical protein